MDAEIFDRAHAVMTERRTKARTENDARIREVNEKIPEMREINDTLYNTGHELIKLATGADPGVVAAKVTELKVRNYGAQQLSAQLLVEHGYPADYLDLHYACPKCCDTGYNGSSFCTCMNELIGKLTAEKLNRSSSLTLSSFDTFSLRYYHGDDYYAMERILSYTKGYAAGFSEASGNILMFGNTGLGKTHISLSIANEVLKKGYSVIYDSIINILRIIEKEHFGPEHSTEMLDSILDADLLILDDLGTEYETRFTAPTIYNIVNTRLIREKPTIISTNMEIQGISDRYGGKVASRIATMYTCLNFVGDDIRFQKKREQAPRK